MTKKIGLVIFSLFFMATISVAQTPEVKSAVSEWLQGYAKQYEMFGAFNLKKIQVNKYYKTVSVYTNGYFGSIPFRPELVNRMNRELIKIISPTYPKYKVVIYADNVAISTLIPNAYRDERVDASRLSFTNKEPTRSVFRNWWYRFRMRVARLCTRERCRDERTTHSVYKKNDRSS